MDGVCRQLGNIRGPSRKSHLASTIALHDHRVAPAPRNLNFVGRGSRPDQRKTPGAALGRPPGVKSGRWPPRCEIYDEMCVLGPQWAI